MNIYAVGTLFVQLTLGMNMFITAQGFAKNGMISVIIGAVCNVILDPILIFGFNLGVKGNTCDNHLTRMLMSHVLTFLFGKKTKLKIKKKNLSLDNSVILPCLALGLSTFVMQSSESVIQVCFNSSLLKYGGDIAVGAMTILTSVMQFAMLPLQGLGQGAQPIISYNYGAKNKERVQKTFKLLVKVSLLFSMAIWLLIQLFPQLFVGLFTNASKLSLFTTKALRIYMAVVGLFGIQIACQMTFVALGNAKTSVIVAVTRKFILLIPLIYIMPALLADKTMAVYLAEPVADLFAITFLQ